MKTSTNDQPRILRIMADHLATGLWWHDGREANPDKLPLTEGLKARLASWCATFEKLDFPQRIAGDTQKPNWEQFSEEGFAIAKALKAELPEWTVLYFDEAKAPWNHAPVTPKVAHEYEVSAA